jgi:tetratricopeptide (TPR) repeat protein
VSGKAETGRLVGRGPALEALRAAAGDAAGRRGRLVLLAGEPGIGKTALLAEIAGEVANAGSLVFWAQCWDGDGAPGYWPWVQIVRAGMAAGGDAREAAMLLPERKATAHTGSGQATDARFRLFDAVVSMLAGLAAQRLVLVVVDDLHWADDGSLRLLEFAVRHLEAHSVLLLGAYRDEDAGPELRRVAAMAEHVNLLGLSRRHVATIMESLTGDTPTEVAAAEVWRRTGGNPLLIRELTRLVAPHTDRAGGRVPPRQLYDRVRDILERRFARLSQRCVDVLTVAAVCGPEVRVDLLATLAGDVDEVARLVDEAVAARVLDMPATAADPYRFAHDLFRETLVAGLPVEVRRRLHLEVARSLEQRREAGEPVHPAELAAHFSAAAPEAPAEALHYGMLAGDDSSRGLAFEEACGHYERALAALAFVAEPELSTRLDVLLRLGEARKCAGRAKAALESYREAADVARRLGDAEGLARAAVGVHGLGWRDSHAESIGLLDEATRTLPGADSGLRAQVLASLARALHHSWRERDWDRAPVLAEEAVAIARALDDPHTLAFCLLALHDARWRPGTADERLPIIDEMLGAAVTAGNRDMEAQARLLRATAVIESGDPSGIDELDRYCRLCEELGHARGHYGALSRRATAALLEGRLAEAEQGAEEAFALGHAIGEPDAGGVRETLLWALQLVNGAWPADRGPSLDSEPWPGLPLARAVRQVALGEIDAARHLLVRLDLADLPRTYDLELLAFLSKAVAVAGHAEQQDRVYQMLRPHAGTHIVVGGCASYLGAVDHYLGLLARSLGRHDDARRHFEDAATLHERLGATAWQALSEVAAQQLGEPAGEDHGVFRREGAVWTITYHGERGHLPDAKGLRDLAVLLARPGRSVHAAELDTGRPFQMGADAVLDGTAKAAYRQRLADLGTEIDEAEAHNDLHRAEKAHAERDALIAELSAAVGLGGRDRRLGDTSERARKAVTARIRDAIIRIERVNTDLAHHLRDSIQTGTWCTYTPSQPTHWTL